MSAFVQMNERRQAVCMDASIELEAIARALASPCTFGPNVALGILSALSCCAEVASAAAEGSIFPMAVRVDACSAAHEHMEQAAMQARDMNRSET